MLNGKKVLLILGAIPVLKEIILKAKAKGIYVIVTDYYEKSDIKDLADEQWSISIDDVDSIVKKCRDRNVDGVMNYCLDPGQKPYQAICQKLGLPCTGNFEQFDIMTNKDKFVETCKKYGVGTIPEYDLNDIQGIEYPVMVKPVDSRASKGLVVCYSPESILESIKYAMSFSKRKVIRIEKYMKNLQEIIIKYFAVDGDFYLTTMSDCYTCYLESGERVYYGSQTYPSRYYNEFIKTTNKKVIHMLKGIGIKNGAMSLTCFYDNGVFRFFDPSMRMGGAQDWRVCEAASGIDISDCLTDFALNGLFLNPKTISKVDKAFVKKYSALLYFDLRKGKIEKFEGIEKALEVSGVTGYHQNHFVGDEITSVGTANNVAIRFIISCDTRNEFIETVKKVQGLIVIEDENRNSLIAPLFDPNQIAN